jgi:muramoyltetrapeptide carboxypeptidase LdcA involved in peptidoglycan recycling
MSKPEFPAYPGKPRPGDRVAVLSPAAGLPGLFPRPYELGLNRLAEDFGLLPVEYATTRRMDASPRDRAADIHAAFADPTIKAVFASIGGDDQITVLRYLDRELIRANPKPFFGWSDNTNLLAYLWNCGIVGYYGGSLMVEFGRPGEMHALTESSLRAAMFTSGEEYELTTPGETRHIEQSWDDPATFESSPPMEPAGAWEWHNAERGVVEGATWGGCLEIVGWLLMADREILPPQRYEGCVLFLETSEDMPSAEEVYRTLRNMGERGLLARFPALLMGRAKAWSFAVPLPPEERERYAADQREAVLRALKEYAPDTLAVLDVDLGHTDPRVVMPYGGRVRVDGPGRRIFVTY